MAKTIMAKTKEELKKCPFCKGEAKLRRPFTGAVKHGYSFHCTICYVSTRAYKTEAEAITAWNHRPLEDELLEALKNCRDTTLILCTLIDKSGQAKESTEIAKQAIARSNND